jgi:acetate CoA/acetoacetate CoA-transferase beta subunit
MAVIAFRDGVATLLETAPGVSVQQVLDATGAALVVPDEVPQMPVDLSSEGDAA